MQTVSSIEEPLTEVKHYLTQVRRDLRLPGLAIAVVYNGRVVYAGGFGSASPGRPVSAETPFVIGSLTKSFTAMALMQLREAGKIDLDTPIQRYLPWFQVADPIAATMITPRHLLTHTSGISRFVGRELLGQTKNVGMEQRVRALCRLKLRRFGTFQYSNTNYLILGLLIETVSGETYGDYIRQHIFEPLGMRHSHVIEREATADGLATGYRWMFGLPIPGQTPYLSDALPAAFLSSSAQDMAAYLRACLDAGTSNSTLLPPEGFAELYRPQISVPGKKSSYALGWRAERIGILPILYHGGEVADFRAEMVLIPAGDLGIVVLANCNNGVIAQAGLDHITPGVVQLLLGGCPIGTKISFRQFYGILDLTILALSSLQLWSTLRLLRPDRSSRWNTIAMLGNFIAPILALWRIPRLADSPWSLLRYYVPDITAWLVGMGTLSLVKGILRAVRLLKAR